MAESRLLEQIGSSNYDIQNAMVWAGINGVPELSGGAVGKILLTSPSSCCGNVATTGETVREISRTVPSDPSPQTPRNAMKRVNPTFITLEE